MRGLSKVVLFILFLAPLVVSGQNYINNPYTRYAIGDLINSGLGYNRSMGGSGIALRPINQVNYINPAAYTAQDTMSFLFQAGLTGRMSTLASNEASDHAKNVNIEFLTMGFPITRWWKFSVGLVPYSRIQYNYLDQPDLGQPEDLSISYTGSGGFNEFYFGSAWEPIKDVSIGINAGYLFGKLRKERIFRLNNSGLNPTSITEDYTANDFYFKFGLQYHPNFTDKKDHKHQFIVGATYDSKANVKVRINAMSARYFIVTSNIYELVDTFDIVDSLGALTLPQKFGIGFSYVYDDRLAFTAEYSRQNFTQGIGINRYDRLADYSSYRFGLEYIPVPITDRQRAKYYERIHYRIGGHFTNTYLSFDGKQITDYGISAGLGFPWRNSQKLYTHTSFNLTYEYGIRGSTSNNLLKENYHIITIGITLHDFWFLKPKYD
jgi:hypothetical protein